MFVADKLGITMGHAISHGHRVGLLPALAGLATARWVNRGCPSRPSPEGETAEALGGGGREPESEFPGFLPSIAPVVLPLILSRRRRTLYAIMKHATAETRATFRPRSSGHPVLGNKNVALLIGALIALAVTRARKTFRGKISRRASASPSMPG